MDKAKRPEKEVIMEPIDWDKMMREGTEVFQKQAQFYANVAKRPLTAGSKKWAALNFKLMTELSWQLTFSTISLWKAVIDTNDALIELFEQMQKSQSSTKEMQETISKLKDATAPISRIAGVMEKLDQKLHEDEENAKKSEKARGAYSV